MVKCFFLLLVLCPPWSQCCHVIMEERGWKFWDVISSTFLTSKQQQPLHELIKFQRDHGLLTCFDPFNTSGYEAFLLYVKSLNLKAQPMKDSSDPAAVKMPWIQCFSK